MRKGEESTTIAERTEHARVFSPIWQTNSKVTLLKKLNEMMMCRASIEWTQ